MNDSETLAVFEPVSEIPLFDDGPGKYRIGPVALSNDYVNEEEPDGTAARFVTAWNSEPQDIERLLAIIAKQ